MKWYLTTLLVLVAAVAFGQSSIQDADSGAPVDILLCDMAADQTDTSANAENPIVWDYSDCTSSTLGKALWFPSEIDGSTITVPTGVTRFNVFTVANQEGSAAIDRRRINLVCVAGCTDTMDERFSPQTSYTTTASAITTASFTFNVDGVTLDAGDTFEINQVQHSAGTLDIFSAGTYLRIEAY